MLFPIQQQEPGRSRIQKGYQTPR